MKAKFVSVWAMGDFETDCEVDLETGFISNIGQDDGTEDRGCLIREFVRTEDGEEYDVCEDCHEYILQSVMVDDQFKNYTEEFQCKNPMCDSNQ